MRVVRSHLLLMIAAGFAVGLLIAGSVAAEKGYLLMIGSAALGVVASLCLVAMATARLREVVSRESNLQARQSLGQLPARHDLHIVSRDLCVVRGIGEKPSWEEPLASGAQVQRALQKLVEEAIAVLNARRVEVELLDTSQDAASGDSMRIVSAENRGSSAVSQGPAECFAQPLTMAGTPLGNVRVWVPKIEGETEHEIAYRANIRSVLGFFAREVLMVVMSGWYAAQRRDRGREVQVAVGYSLLDQFDGAVCEPVGTIVNGVELLLAGDLGELDQGQQRSLEILRRDAQRLREVAHDVMTYRRATSGDEKVRIESFDAWMSVERELASLRSLVEEKAHVVEFPGRAQRPIFASCDQQHFGRIVRTLLHNAILYTPPGGRIVVSLEAEGEERVHIKVQDTGVGIPDSDTQHLLQPFRRGTHPYIRMQSGLGLGLSLAHELAKLQGGALSISGTPGEGTLVSLTVPRGEQSLLPRPLQSEDEIAGDGRLVLFVQPEESDAALVVPYLERRGYRVILAADEGDARRKLAAGEVALVLLSDRFEPQPSSRLAQFVREEQRGEHIPVVLLTRRAFLFDDDWYLHEDVDRCFLRPVDLKEVGRAVMVVAQGEQIPCVQEAVG